MTCFLFQECVPPQCEQLTVPGFSSAAANTSSSITTPVTFNFFVTGHRTRIRFITGEYLTPPAKSSLKIDPLGSLLRTEHTRSHADCVDEKREVKPTTSNSGQQLGRFDLRKLLS